MVSDLGQVGGLLRILWFPPPIKLTAMTELLLKVALKHHKPQTNQKVLYENS
jgi:hypothetical protein